MHLNRRIQIQLAIFSIIAVVAGAVMVFGYIKVPKLLGIGQYTVTVELPRAAGLYASGNVTYRGTEVGRITDVHLTDTGVAAVLSLRSDVKIPSDLQAQVHSVTALGEQYIALTPRNGTSVPLKNGDVISVHDASVPPDINSLVEATNRGLQAIPRDNLKTAVDESFTAVGGLGPELARFVHGSTALAIDARRNLNEITTLIDQSQPVLDSQTKTADSIQAWASHLATISAELKEKDGAVAGILQNGGQAAAQTRQLFERLQPSLPVLLANLVTVGDVALAYQPNIEQLLVLVPQIVQEFQGGIITNLNTKQDYKGAFLDFNLNVNLPPPCETGYLPPQQRRSAALVDFPDPPEGDIYCRVPQDSNLVAVRGARNAPCATVPGKRAPTVKMCESNEQYEPLNDGTNWKGDPNATLSGQAVPQLPPGSPPAASPPTPPIPPVAVVPYDPATGSYVAPDGTVHTQANLGQDGKEPTWQSMLIPPSK
jgi:phospholipid/cholesterol/gamma-HCH transport system substrate-binding protein